MHHIRHCHHHQQQEPGGDGQDIPDEFGGVESHDDNNADASHVGHDLYPAAELLMALHEVKHAQCLRYGIGQEGEAHQTEGDVALFYQMVVGTKDSCQHIGEEEYQQAHRHHHQYQHAEDAFCEHAKAVVVFFTQQNAADIADSRVRA